MLRDLINRFSRSVSGKMAPLRRNHTAPVKVWFDPDVKTERALELARSACILGETEDISRTGIGILMQSIRLKEKYLAGQERILNLDIDLPNGKVHVRGIGRRYAKVGHEVSVERFLVGVEIVEFGEGSQEIYEAFLRNGAPDMRGHARPIKIGID
jgi:hypothetical protein